MINNDLADMLLTIAGNADEPKQLRARAAISLGPILEQADTEQADTDGLEDPDAVPITEGTFPNIQDSLEKVYCDKSTPQQVRRRILEASVRAPQTWYQDAIWHAYSRGDKEWVLTAVFSMRWARGFDDQILQALKSEDPEIHYQAVIAAGNWELNVAWPHIVELVNDAHSSNPDCLPPSALSAASVPRRRDILEDLAESDDEDITEAVTEALAAVEDPTGEEGDDEDERVN